MVKSSPNNIIVVHLRWFVVRLNTIKSPCLIIEGHSTFGTGPIAFILVSQDSNLLNRGHEPLTSTLRCHTNSTVICASGLSFKQETAL